MTREYFLKKANEKHNNKYVYKNIPDNIKSKDRITVTCPIHGEFIIIVNNLLNGRICPGCNMDTIKNLNTINFYNNFIEKAKLKHNNKYDYSKVEYIDAKTNVCIICPDHGEFWQTPDTHSHRSGCPKCGLENKKTTLSNTDEFINKAKIKHEGKYDYSKVEYIKDKAHVCIICPEHGEFWQTPTNHIQGKGCPKCFLRKHTRLKNLLQRKPQQLRLGPNVVRSLSPMHAVIRAYPVIPIAQEGRDSIHRT